MTRMGSWMMLAAASLTGGIAAEARDRSVDEVRRENDRILFASYPRGALRRGEQGVVGIRVTTDVQGRLRDCAVTRSSGFPELDEASCDMLLQHMRMRPYLAPNGGGVVRRQDGQVVWTLPKDRRGPVAVAAAGAGNPAGQKKICRVQSKTGSLVASQRICLTRAQWQLQYQLVQDETRDMRPGFLPGE